jgi:hypothetical protein
MDHIIFSGNSAAVQELKSIFGLEALEDIRDFANTIAFPSSSLHVIAIKVFANISSFAF